MGRRYVVGTRGSKLSLIQTEMAVGAIRKLFPDADIEIRVIKTEGDKKSDLPLSIIGGLGVFTKDIEKELISKNIDMAVHSLKDLPPKIMPGLAIGAVLKREDPRDVLISSNGAKLDGLPKNARIGTSSPRRTSQLLAYRKDFQIINLRGNVDTRLKKLDNNEYDAIIIAAAGVARLGMKNRITQFIEPSMMIPSPSQGALAIEIREGDKELAEMLKKIEDKSTRIATDAEREFLRRFGVGCRMPVGAYAEVKAGKIKITGMISNEDGTELYKAEISSDAKDNITAGAQLAEKLLAAGGAKLIRESTIYNTDSLRGKLILITRPKEQSEQLSSKLKELGAVPILLPMIAIRMKGIDEKTMKKLGTYDIVIFTSANAAKALAQEGITELIKAKTVAIGPETASILAKGGMDGITIPKADTSEEIAKSVGNVNGKRILLPQSDIAESGLYEMLKKKGAVVDRVVVYDTVATKPKKAELSDVFSRKIDVITIASPSAAKNLSRCLKEIKWNATFRPKIVCIGPKTAAASSDVGLKPDSVAEEHTTDGIIKAILR
ncbi:MAG: hydroxymethylbilane synthase [Candidatus Micrarchaeota archaeon]|nr:hydroxymethylbilane synthase [Candidatus Micrarchaeota archaeon]